jgi:hypothetical protein
LTEKLGIVPLTLKIYKVVDLHGPNIKRRVGKYDDHYVLLCTRWYD